MAKKRKSHFSRTLFSMIVFAYSFFSSFKYKITLLGTEARIALRGIFKSLILAVFLGVMLATTWISLLAMLFLYILNLPTSPYLSLLVVILINMVVMIIVSLMIAKLMRNISLQKIRLNLFDLE